MNEIIKIPAWFFIILISCWLTIGLQVMVFIRDWIAMYSLIPMVFFSFYVAVGIAGVLSCIEEKTESGEEDEHSTISI